MNRVPPVWIGDWSERGDEAPAVEHMSRMRPQSILARVPRAMRVAEIVCSRGEGRPRVVAVVYPRGVPLDQCAVDTEHQSYPVGHAVQIDCTCGYVHLLDGGKLRAALIHLPRAGRTPTVDAASVSKD
jgi:hypothetical protein